MKLFNIYKYKFNILLPLLIIILIILSIRFYWIKQEKENYISTNFYSDLYDLSEIINTIDINDIGKLYNNLYEVRSTLINSGNLIGYSNYVHKNIFGRFYLLKKGKDCFLFELNLDKEYKNKVNLINFKNFLTNNLNSGEKCSLNSCKLFFTEKGILYRGKNYECK